MRTPSAVLFASILGLCPVGAFSQADAPHEHEHGDAKASPSRKSPQPAHAPDARQRVQFPKAIKEHTLSSMRDHLLALTEISEALGHSDYDKAANIAESRLGMSSLNLHGADQSAQYMPKGMQDIGLSLHRSASQFAVAAQDAAASNDMPKALKSFANLGRSCVACHAAYRLD
jgi:hypothetical protein